MPGNRKPRASAGRKAGPTGAGIRKKTTAKRARLKRNSRPKGTRISLNRKAAPVKTRGAGKKNLPRAAQVGYRGKKQSSTNRKAARRPPARSSRENRSAPEPAADAAVALMEDYADVSEERAVIVSLVRDLEGQVDTAFKLKEALEVDLDATRKRLSEESAARAELEMRAESLAAQAALVDELRRDVSFAEEERNRLASLLARTQPQLDAVTRERDSLAKEAGAAEARARKLEGEKTVLEAQMMNLKDKLVNADRLESELENLQEEFASIRSQTAELGARLEEQQAANAELVETTARLESELKMSNANHETTRSELEAARKALHDIYSEATRTSGRLRQHYVKAKGKK